MAIFSKKTNHQPEQQQEPTIQPEMGFQILSLDLIDDPEQPMRSDLTEASVEDLVLSIKQVGIIEPIVLKPMNGRYEVIAGHRRTFAARLAKLAEVPCYIRKANMEQTEMLKIHENLYREDIKPPDEAKHFSYLISKQKMTPIQIAKIISKSPTYVTDRLAILEYPDFLMQAMQQGEISFAVAKEFIKFSDVNQMRSAVYYAKRAGMTGELARKWVQDHARQQEQTQIQEHPTFNPDNGQQEIEHTATCVYCKEGLRLIEAEVVYMHSKCLAEVNKPPEE